MKLWCVLALAAGVFALALPVGATDGPDPAALERARWVDRLRHEHAELREAREQEQRAEAAYRDWRQRKRPRGEAKAEMLAELERARLARREAEAEFPELLERARRAGVPPGVLRDYE